MTKLLAILQNRRFLGFIMPIVTLSSLLFAEGPPKVRHSVFGMGGSSSISNSTHHLRSTVGEALAGKTSSTDKTASQGFWAIRFLEAEFTLSDDSGYLDLNVDLGNISSVYRTELTGCSWDFGDGSSLSTSAENCNTEHLFLLPDSLSTIDYTVTLTITGIYGELDVETNVVHLIRITPEFVFQFMDGEDYYPDAIIQLSDALTVDPDDLIEISTWQLGSDSLIAIAEKTEEGYEYTCVQGGENFDCNSSCEEYDEWGNGFEEGAVCWEGRSPTHRFSEYGDILITLTVTDGENTESVSHTAEVKWFLPIFQTQLNIGYNPENLIEYDGNSDQLQGYVPLSVSFNDSSELVNTYLDSCFWDFGDGNSDTIIVNEDNPNCSAQHTYLSYNPENPFDVSFTVSDTNRSKNISFADHIRVVHPFPGDSVLFVSNSGDDGNEGSFEAPLNTIQEAVKISEHPEGYGINTIVVEEGLYEENVIVTHPSLHITSYFSVDSLADHIENTIVDGGWKDTWPNESDEYFEYMEGYNYYSPLGAYFQLSARSVFLFSNEYLSGNMDFYNPGRTAGITRLTGFTIQHGLGTSIQGNWDMDYEAENRRMGGGLCVLGSLINANYNRIIQNGKKNMTDDGGGNSLVLSENTHIGDVDRLFRSESRRMLLDFIRSPHDYPNFTRQDLFPYPKKLPEEEFTTSATRESYEFDFSNNYYEKNYAIIGKTLTAESTGHEIFVDFKKSSLDYVYNPPGGVPDVSNYWVTKDQHTTVSYDECQTQDEVLTGDVTVPEGVDVDVWMGKIYGGDESRDLETTLTLSSVEYDTSTTTFPIQMVSNTLIQGAGGRDAPSILNSQYMSQVLIMREVSNIHLKDIEIKNGVTMQNGGGIEMINSSENTFDNVVVSGSVAAKRGGGIYIRNDEGPVRDDGEVIVTDVEINENNSLLEGGGLYFNNADLYISGVEIIDNNTHNSETQYHGGGIFGQDAGNVVIENSIIDGNTASITVGTAGSWGGGIQFENVNVGLRNVQITDNKAIDKAGAIYLRDSNLNMYNCTIADNELLYGAWGAGIHAQKTGLGGHNYLYITNSIIRDNQNATFPNTGSQLAGDVFSSFGIDMYIHHTDIQGLGNYSNPYEMMAYFQLMLQDAVPGHENTNIDEDPLFITVDENDYHLGADSPCIDVGTDTLTVEGDLIVEIPASEYFGGEPDMGANEWETENLGDINGDGSIDVLDIVELVAAILAGDNFDNGDMK